MLGILSLVICGLLGPVAWSMGSKALKEIDANPSAYSNRGSVQGGRVCGMIASALLVFVFLAFIAIFLLAFLGESSSTS